MNEDPNHSLELELVAQDETKHLKRRPRKNVQFNRFLQEIPCEIIPGEDSKRKQNWYTHSDKMDFERDMKNTIKIFKKARNSGTLVKDPWLCLRGLEGHLSMRTFLNRKSLVKEYKASLVNEQQRRRMMGLTQPFAMNEYLRPKSKWALEQALHVAQKDARDAVLEACSPCGNNTDHMNMANILDLEECPGCVTKSPGDVKLLALGQPNKEFAVSVLTT